MVEKGARRLSLMPCYGHLGIHLRVKGERLKIRLFELQPQRHHGRLVWSVVPAVNWCPCRSHQSLVLDVPEEVCCLGSAEDKYNKRSTNRTGNSERIT